MKYKNGILETFRCPHCKIHHPNFEPKWQSSASFSEDDNTMTKWELFECNNCYSPVTIKLASINSIYEIVDFFPKINPLHPSIPEKAKHYLQQAIDSINSPEASMLLSCSAIDSMFKEIGFKEGNLYSRISQAEKENRITKSMKIWSDKIRLDANAIRHADENKMELTIDDARNTLEFILALAEFLFVIPYKINQTRKIN